MRRRHVSRRDFLKGLGLSSAIAPFVPTLNHYAEAAGFPQRLLLTFAPNGTILDSFWPTGTETAFTFPAGCITESLKPFQASTIYAKNMARTNSPRSGPHDGPMGTLWTASQLVAADSYPTGPSIDQILVSKLPRTTTFPSLEASVHHDETLGAQQADVTKHMIYSAANTPVAPEPNPYKFFQRLMLGSGSTTSTGGMTVNDLTRVRAQRQSVIDLVNAELKMLSGKVGTDDRKKLDSHVTALRDIEKELQASMPPVGTPGMTSGCSAPSLDQAYQAKLADNDSFPAVVKMQSDLMVAALACDRTRIASIQWSRTFSMIVHKWAGVSKAHHTQSHQVSADPTAKAGQIKVSTWYAQQLAYLLGLMSKVTEGGGTMLDNSLVVWAYDMADGEVHDVNPAVAVLVGNLGGRMKTGTNGRLVDLKAYEWSQMLVTICQAMGAMDVTKVGNLGKSGAIPGIFG